jgi:hypothetical protein
MLSMQFSQVRWNVNLILLPAEDQDPDASRRAIAFVGPT